MVGYDANIASRVHGLSDLELALLLSLISHEHCVIGTPEDSVDDVVNELYLISIGVFGLQGTVIDCHEHMTLESFITSLFPPASASPNTLTNPIGHHHDQNQPFNDPASATTDYFRLPTPRTPSSTLTTGPRSPRSSACMPSIRGTDGSRGPGVATPMPALPPESNASAGMANIVIAKNLNRAPQDVQIQALELMRTRRLALSTTMQSTPKLFSIVGVVAAERGFYFHWNSMKESGQKGTSAETSRQKGGETYRQAPHMIAHLNDFFSMGHWHDPTDGYPNTEERAEYGRNEEGDEGKVVWRDGDSIIRHSEPGVSPRTGSVSTDCSGPPRRNSRIDSPTGRSLFPEADIEALATAARDVHVSTEVMRYEANVVAFLRVHRAVAVVGPSAGGASSVSPIASKHFEKLARCLALLHQLDYVTPALVALAARKTYLHRIRTVSVNEPKTHLVTVHERSMQWGSEKPAVEALLEGVSPEDVIESVLKAVLPPV